MNLIEQLKIYLEESGVEVGDIDTGGKEVCDIKSDPILLSEFYIKYFNEFRKIFADCTIPEVRTFINNNYIFLELIKYSAYKNSDLQFGKTRAENILRNYVLNQYDDIAYFFDLYLEVCG